MSTVDPNVVLEDVLASHADADKWTDSRFEKIRRLPNTKVGDVGQDFIEKLCEALGFKLIFPENKAGKRAKQSPWDIKINEVEFELKTATEDVSSKFQFNHIRYHRNYDAVMCLGIAPEEAFFGLWSKADLTTNKAGTLVSMEKGANASYKLTKSRATLSPISELEDALKEFLSKFGKP